MGFYRLASLSVFTVLLTAIIITPVLSTSSSEIITPLSISPQSGSTSGSLSSLNLLDQSNTDDNPSAYLLFSSPAGIYSGFVTYELPTGILPDKISSFLLQVNFKGPADASQVWSWSVFDWQSQLWIKVGDTIGIQPDAWNDLTFRVRSFSKYISSNREIRIRLQSNNDTADAKVDYQALHITYIPVAPTATRSIANAIPSKGAFILPTTVTPSPTLTPSITPSPTSTLTLTPTNTRTPTKTPTGGFVSTVFFPIGPGGSDVIPHQVVRANNDKLYIFANQQGSRILRVYRTTNPGLPDNASAFATVIQATDDQNIISVDAVYGGGTFIHALVNTQDGDVKDYPFDTSTNTFKPAITLVSDGGIVPPGMYVGSSGVAGMFDLSGNFHIAYWTNANHIMYRSYTYTSATNNLSPREVSFTQLDTAGNANHPAMAISPFDNSVTVAWVSQAASEPTGFTKILTRTRDALGIWKAIDQNTNTSDAWVFNSPISNGVNVDQGPSLLIDSAGTKHMVYIEECCELGRPGSSADYGRVHYLTDSGSGWVDTELNIFTHDPALGLSTAGNMYIIAHGHPNNFSGVSDCLSMGNMCYIKKNSNGTWGASVLFATPPNNSFDSSPSVKWSAVGWNRSNAVEFVFFKTPYDTPTIYYGRLP